MPELPSKLARYIELDRIEKEAKAEKESIKPEVKELLKDGDYEEISLGSRQKSPVFIDEKLYSWLTKELEKKDLDYVTLFKIDFEKLDELYRRGAIKNEVPSDAYTTFDPESVINIKRTKK